MSQTIQLDAFAKVNWILKILGRRADGFHELQTILQTISLNDTIRIALRKGAGIHLTVSGLDVPPTPENLVWKTADRFLSEAGKPGAITIELEKRIPVGAGLGGGSSDAAATLLALNQLFGHPLSRSQLLALAADLGSDVPFFLAGGTVLAEGRGEKLEELPDVPPTSLILVYPDFQITAREAYQLGNWPPIEDQPMLTIREANNRILRFRRRIARGSPFLDLAENDFDAPLFENYPEIARVRALLDQAGCDKVIVSGSGSTLLGLAPAERIEEIRGELQRKGVGAVFAATTLARSEYVEALRVSGIRFDESWSV